MIGAEEGEAELSTSSMYFCCESMKPISATSEENSSQRRSLTVGFLVGSEDDAVTKGVEELDWLGSVPLVVVASPIDDPDATARDGACAGAAE